MHNDIYLNQSNCSNLFVNIDYQPIVYFLSPPEERMEIIYCEIEYVSFPDMKVLINAYAQDTNEWVMDLVIPFDEINPYELPHLGYGARIQFYLGEFVCMNHSSENLRVYYDPKLHRISVRTMYRNREYYKQAIENMVNKLSKVFD